MKLYIYEHCPFCARVVYIAQSLNIDIEFVDVDYHDAQTLIDLIGQKMVPVLQKEDGTVMAESMDIIAYFLSLASQPFTAASAETSQFQQQAFPLIQSIGYPRWPHLDLPEFASEASKVAWKAKKQTAEFHFETLLKETPAIVKQVELLLSEAEKNLALVNNQSTLLLLDQAIYFSLLRGFYAEPSITWPPALDQWMNERSNTLSVRLLR